MEAKRMRDGGTNEHSAFGADEKIASLFQPDTLLSEQFFENLQRATFWEPEKRLMLAILRDAITCWQDNLYARNVKKKRLLHETEEWITTVDDDWVFSFDSVCETLGLNPAYVRQGLFRWRERNRKQRHSLGGEEPTKLAG